MNYIIWKSALLINVRNLFKFFILKNHLLNNFIKYLKSYSGQKSEIKNYSYMAKEVILEINSIFGARVFPFFGTLLSIVRDGEFKFADDFDFATTDKNIFTINSIRLLEDKGFSLHKVSLVGGDKIVELSFLYKGVNIDIFLLDIDSDNYLVHNCPDFRTSFGSLYRSNTDLVKVVYNKYFSVRYRSFDLIWCNSWNCHIPSNASKIFEIHYGLDWMIPKTKNFIDYRNYKFHNIKSILLMSENGNVESLIKALKDITVDR